MFHKNISCYYFISTCWKKHPFHYLDAFIIVILYIHSFTHSDVEFPDVSAFILSSFSNDNFSGNGTEQALNMKINAQHNYQQNLATTFSKLFYLFF